tara:strand:- start:733 stop:1041 length:309 start_codon:yes stop_codon:yes gene_type:complete
MKEEIDVHVYDKLIEIMRSSNPEDFLLGMKMYETFKTSMMIDILMLKSFSGDKRTKLSALLNIKSWDIPTLKYITEHWVPELDTTSTEIKIFKRIEDEYNNY